MFHATHRRYNPLLGEWVLVSPHRSNRPWQGHQESVKLEQLPKYDTNCYLCPGNTRAGNQINPNYTGPFVFVNDFSAILPSIHTSEINDGLFRAHSEQGICKVVCFSENHSATVPELELSQIEAVIQVWIDECISISKNNTIHHIQIFENKGSIMGCSNPHPHCQIWAQESIPDIVQKEHVNQFDFFTQHNSQLLAEYVQQEIDKGERVVCENEYFIALVPFWAIWPFETIIIPKHNHPQIISLSNSEISSFASIYKEITCKYDNLFSVSFPYSAGIHQAPYNTENIEHWRWHMHFYPPLLRSAEIKKYMVGYEMLAEPQRDITPEQAAQILQKASSIHFKHKRI